MSGKRKKILFLEYFSFFAGGQKVLVSIIEYMRKKYDVEVLLFNRGAIEEKLKELGIKTGYIQAPKSPKYRYIIPFFVFMNKLTEYIKKGGYDLVYSSGFFATKLSAFSCAAAKVPLIWHKHQIITKKPFSYLSLNVRFLSFFTKKIICVSDASKRSMLKAGVNEKKLITVRNGIAVPAGVKSDTGAAFRKKFGLKSADTVIGTVGYFRRNKGLDILVEAAALLKDIKELKFVLVGKSETPDTSYEEELKKKTREKGLSKKLIFAGFYKAFDCLKAFDYFVLPSDNEPFALSVLEALGCGIPVIAFDSGGTVEVVKDGFNGYIAREMNAASLAETIKKAFLNKRKRKELSLNARNDIRKIFTISRQMKQIYDVIESVIS